MSPRGPSANTNRVSPHTACVSGSIAGNDQVKLPPVPLVAGAEELKRG
jgi:hypothetical protein